MRRSRRGRPKVSRTSIKGNRSRMSEPAIPNGEESIDESGRNLTQQEIDKEGASEAPVDPGWKEEDDNG
jgi:hypothetical protein